jgi:hypothetical protein
MPSQRDPFIRHVSRAPTRGGDFVPMRVTSMTLAHAQWWQSYVQPWIDQSSSPRADQGWRWPRIFATCSLLAGALRQHPAGLVAGIIRGGELMPVCMALIVESYPYLPDSSKNAVFLWYATRCPDDVVQRALRIPSGSLPKRLMEITVDLAVTQSFNRYTDGRIGLHAAAEGGEGLCQKYASFGLLRLPRTKVLPKGPRRQRGNDGRYFYHSEQTALQASKRLDAYR